MDCLQCVRKHLANAISYAKEVLAGHGEGGDPDHRPDLLGELGNAEHHLSVNEQYIDFRDNVLNLRRRFETEGYNVFPGLIAELRQIWVRIHDTDGASIPLRAPAPRLINRDDFLKKHRDTTRRETMTRRPLPITETIEGPIDVLILPGNTKEELEGIKSMVKNVQGTGKIYEELPKDPTNHILVWPPKTGIIRPTEAGAVYPAYVNKKNEKDWTCKPQLVEASKWKETPDLNTVMKDIDGRLFSAPFCLAIDKAVNNICCGDKNKLLDSTYFIKWSGKNWTLIKTFLTDHNIVQGL